MNTDRELDKVIGLLATRPEDAPRRLASLRLMEIVLARRFTRWADRYLCRAVEGVEKARGRKGVA